MVLPVDKFMKISRHHRVRSFDLTEEENPVPIPASELDKYEDELKRLCIPVPKLTPKEKAIGRLPAINKKINKK